MENKMKNFLGVVLGFLLGSFADSILNASVRGIAGSALGIILIFTIMYRMYEIDLENGKY